MDIFQSLALLHAYQYGKNVFRKVFLIICVIDKLKNGIKDLFFEDIDFGIIKRTLNKINSNDSEFILIHELLGLIENDRENEIFDVKMHDNIRRLYKSNFYKIHSVYRRKNYKYEVEDLGDDNDNDKIIACFHHGFGTNKAIKRNGKFYFNKMECKFDSFIDTNKLDEIIFYSNILISGKLKVSIVSK